MNEIWYSRQWDNAPMPHSVFFMKDGHAIHGSNDVKNLGKPASHGCVRISPENATTLYALVGRSGCGKSTLLNVIGGLMTPSSGAVEVAGKPVRGPMPQDIAFVFQENALFPWNTVLENVRLGMLFQGVQKSEHEARAKLSLEAVGLIDFAHHYPSQLSGGMRQRAALARALSLKTDILLMDEPFGALDEQTRMILGEDLSLLLARANKTIVFVTHSLGEATFLADRVAVFSARPGSIKQLIAVDEPHPRKPEFVTSAKFATIRNARTMLDSGYTSALSAAAAKPRLDVVLKREIEAGRLTCGREVISLSVGTAFCPEDGFDVEALLAEADRRMYAVKQTHHAQNASSEDILAQGAAGT